MLETTSSQVFASEVLQLVQALKRDAAIDGRRVRLERLMGSKSEAASPLSSRQPPTPAQPASSKETSARDLSHQNGKPLPHQAGLLHTTGDTRLLEAVAYIHQHLEDPIGVQELVSHVGVSRRWLEYAFRDALGETPYQYIRRQRLEHAGRLLEEEPNSRIYQVALRTGFNSAKQLTMAFRQHFGLSPREYRRKKCG
jgi:AraC-like DNA-binding protein